MALGATVYHFKIALSDVDRGVYESLDLRPARHPSESLRFLLIRTLAYALAYEEGIAFSPGGVSSGDEPALSIKDRTGQLTAWIEVGSPSGERLHKATKLSARVLIFTAADPIALLREISRRSVHRAEGIEVFRLPPTFLDSLEGVVERTTNLEVVRSDGILYVTVGGRVLEGTCEKFSVADLEP